MTRNPYYNCPLRMEEKNRNINFLFAAVVIVFIVVVVNVDCLHVNRVAVLVAMIVARRPSSVWVALQK